MGDTKEQSELIVTGLHGGYGSVPVLHDVGFEARSGEVIGLLGHNGMGKTTLLKTLVGLLPATAGSIKVNKVELAGHAPHERARAGIGYVAQGREIFSGLTVAENIAFGGAASRKSPKGAVDRAVADFPILERLLGRKGGELSGGEQQILALARALAGDPKVLLLDEPTEGVAPAIVEDIELHLTRLSRESDLAIVVVEQDVEFLAAVSSRVLQMQKGRVTGEIPKNRLTTDDLFGFTPDASAQK